MRRQKKPHPVIVWVRATGFAAFLFGCGALLLTDLFWPAVALIYGAFVLALADVWFEPELRKYPYWRFVISAVFLALAAGFSWSIVFVAAPIDISALITDSTYQDGAVLHGVPWRPEFTELQIAIRNPTALPYKNVEVFLKPPMPIAEISQISNVSGVTFETKDDLVTTVSHVDLPSRRRTAVQFDLLATSAGYYVRCPELSPGGSLTLEIALADIRPAIGPKPNIDTLSLDVLRSPIYWQRITGKNGSYWMGHKYGMAYLPRRRLQKDEFAVTGEYVAALRKRAIQQTVKIAGVFNVQFNVP